MKNNYEVRGDTTVIFCETKGVVTEVFIDTEDLPKVEVYPNKWRTRSAWVHYIIHAINRGGKGQITYIHRVILDAPKGLVVDHISGDVNDNRKVNLRLLQQGENVQNLTRLQRNNTSGYRGVGYVNKTGKWRAEIGVNNNNIHLGMFYTKEEANEVVRVARAKMMPFSQEALEANQLTIQ